MQFKSLDHSLIICYLHSVATLSYSFCAGILIEHLQKGSLKNACLEQFTFEVTKNSFKVNCFAFLTSSISIPFLLILIKPAHSFWLKPTI